MVFPGTASWGGVDRPWRQAGVVGILLGIPFGFAVRVVVGAAWAACGIGNEASGGTPLSLILLTVLATGFAVLAVTLTLALSGPRHPVLGATATLVSLALLLWLVIALVATPTNVPAEVCHPANVPPWIPGWLPV
jgi:hypothetical protein